MGAQFSVLELIMSFSQYLRSAMVWFPLWRFILKSVLKVLKSKDQSLRQKCISQMSARGNLMWNCSKILWRVVDFPWVCFFTIWLWYFSSFYLRNGTFQFKAIGCCWHFLLEKLSFNGFPIKTIEKNAAKYFPGFWLDRPCGEEPHPTYYSSCSWHNRHVQLWPGIWNRGLNK